MEDKKGQMTEEDVASFLTENRGELMKILEGLKETSKIHSNCTKKNVGAALINRKGLKEMFFGYNTNHTGFCGKDKYEFHQDGCFGVHAEISAMLYAFELRPELLRQGLADYVMLVTHGSCDQCLKYMHMFKIPLVLYDINYQKDYFKWYPDVKVVSLTGNTE